MRSILSMVLGLGIMAGVGTAKAQELAPATGSGWAGYNPAYGWGSGVPGASVSVVNPPVRIVGQAPSAAWTGYAPYTVWNGYAPGTSWQYVAPSAGTRPAYVRSGSVNLPRGYRSFASPSAVKEFGTGRTMNLAKPWLR